MWTREDWAYAAAMSAAAVVVGWLTATGFGVDLPGPGFGESTGSVEVAVPIAPEATPPSEVESPGISEETPGPEGAVVPAEEPGTPTAEAPPRNDLGPEPTPEPPPEDPPQPARELLEVLPLGL